MSSPVQSGSRVPAAGFLSWVALMTVWFVWGSTFLGIRVAVQSIPPFLMAGTRYTVAGLLLTAILWLMQGRRRQPVTWTQVRSIVIAAVLLLVCGNGLLSMSEVHLESGTAALIVATVPLWMILIDAFLSKKLRPLSIAGIALGTLGVVALVGAPSAHVSLPAAVLVLIGSLSWAIGSVYARRHSEGEANPLLPALEMLAGGLILCTVGLIRGEAAHFDVARLPASAMFGWLWLVVAGAMIAYSAYGYAVRTLPTNLVATYAYVNPIVAVFLGAVLLKESLGWNVLLGGTAIVLSVVAIMLGNRNKAAGQLRSSNATPETDEPSEEPAA
jgi:drug/metabolite transporter (DMT)-like permease